MSNPKIPICLVTGFLGSGKTTLLKHIVATNQHRQLVYLVNEFNPRDIDGAIVCETNPDVISVPGGSIFCKCLVTEFINNLRKIPTTYSSPQGVIIEASGMANPKVMATMLEETGLDELYDLTLIISVVDPGSFNKLRQTLPNIVAQIEASDIALINKIDSFDDGIVAAIEADLQSLNPTISIMKCTHCEVDLDVLAPHSGRHSLDGDYAKCKDPNYDSAHLTLSHDVTPETLQTTFAPVEDEIFRIKGYIQFEGQQLYADYAKSGWTFSPVDKPHEQGLVIIHKGSPSPPLKQVIASL